MLVFLFGYNLRKLRVTIARVIWSGWVLTAFLLAIAISVRGQNDFVRLNSFGNPALSAATPWSTPIEGSDGALYGTTTEGGTNDFGTVFKINKDGSGLQILHRFAGGANDGVNPVGGLTEGIDHALYGTTFSGGLNNGGTIFRLTKDGGTFFILKHLAAGSGSQGSLLNDTDGTLYGTTVSNVFKLDMSGGGFTVLHTLGSGGAQFGVIAGSDGALYGVTTNGGANNLGTVFTLNKDGSSYAVLFNFAGTNGQNPQAGLLEGSDHLLYGTTSFRGTNSYGTVFQLDKTGTNYALLHNFYGTNADGWYPQSVLIEGDDGALYGMCANGGTDGQGTVFKLNKNGGGYSVLHQFTWTNGDGRIPEAGLLKVTDGLLYGTTSRGGTADYGSLFKLDQAGSNETVVASFSWSGGDGWNPQAKVIEASDGALYGTTGNGGSNDFGTVFRMNKNQGSYTVLHHFDWHADGALPQGVIEATNGALFGTAFEGGTNNFGTVFTLNQNGGGFTVLRSVPGTNTAEIEPSASLIEGSDGGLYGVAAGGGYPPTNGPGSVFMLSKDGRTFTNLHTFTGSTNEGRGLAASLMEGTNGALYGTTYSSGSGGYGVVFTVNKDGSGFNVLRSFSNSIFYPQLPVRGINPSGGLIKDNRGLLYGTTFAGFINSYPGTNWGTVFKIGQNGSNFMLIHSFNTIAMGQNPDASLMLASDGALYGTASAGGDMGAGAIFSLADPPSFTGLQPGTGGALLQFQGVSSRSYAVQATTNLAPASWQTLAGSAAWTNGLFQFLDPDAVNFPVKFYRTLTQ